MKEDWTEQLRRKLDGHEMPPPNGLWESISEQMDKPSGLKPHSRLTGTAQRWWAAAAAVLALMGFFALYNSNDNEQPMPANAVSQQQASVQPTNEKLSNNQSVSEQHSAQYQTNVIIRHHNAPTPITHKSQEEIQETISIKEQMPTETERHDDQPVEYEQKPVPKTPNAPVIPVTPETPDTYETPSTHKKWSVGINASGGLLAANTSQRMDRVYVKSGAYHFSGDHQNFAETASSYSLTEYESKHHLPLRFGLSLQYQLNERLSLLSGINYTYLYSEFSIPLYQSASYNQKLHYLGLPIGLSWQLLRASRFHLYLAGGVMMEKCLNEKPWQWSVNGAAGAEYAIASQLGVYLEPSLGYYFSDGTQFEHYYKEHPLAPSIEFGLRLHVGK